MDRHFYIGAHGPKSSALLALWVIRHCTENGTWEQCPYKFSKFNAEICAF